MSNMFYGIIKTEICHVNQGTARVLKDTLAIYRDAVSYIVHVVCDHMDEILPLPANEQLIAMEHLIHHTKLNPNPEYKTFDTIFYKFPSYYRRAAIVSAIGYVQSHETRCDTYYENREKLVKKSIHFKELEPGFTYQPNVCPTLYKKECFKMDENKISIKVYIRNTWDWISVSIPNRDLKSLKKALTHGTAKNPMLIYKYHKFYLYFPIDYKSQKFPETELKDQTVLGVDLGLNNPAVCSVIDASGTVHHRDFAPFKKDMDQINYIINLIRKKSRTSGKGQKLSSLYTKLEGLKENYVRQLARWIVNKAIEYHVYGIVLEHLSSMKGYGNIASKVHHWCTARIRDFIRGMAFREGIRVFIINPRGTSKYAFDGSGTVERDIDNFSLCTFSTGKRYNCDLSASYNIGARYFLRSFRKSIPVMEWSKFKAEVPELSKRTTWTLSALWKLSKCMVS